MKFSIEGGVRIAEVPVQDFRVILYDGPKKSMGANRCTGGFFGTFHEDGEAFTLPAGHLVCDFEATNKWTKKYCQERGQLLGSRFWYDSGAWTWGNELHGKRQSTLVVADGRANVRDLGHVEKMCTYAISGVPVLLNGAAVHYLVARQQGWSDSSLYATYHTFLGIKEADARTIYVMGAKTSTWNMVKTGEAARMFRALGFRDVIKLDGGGSFYFNAAGNTLATGENRRICTIIDMGGPDLNENPYSVPSGALRMWSGNRTGVLWLQWELVRHGFPCELDGSFGPKTDKQLRSFQAAAGLVVDGSCGPATKAALQKA